MASQKKINPTEYTKLRHMSAQYTKSSKMWIRSNLPRFYLSGSSE